MQLTLGLSARTGAAHAVAQRTHVLSAHTGAAHAQVLPNVHARFLFPTNKRWNWEDVQVRCSGGGGKEMMEKKLKDDKKLKKSIDIKKKEKSKEI